MLAMVLLSQHRVLSSKTVRPRAPCGARCIGHAVSTWSAVCSEVPHSQFGERARPHLCMDEWNHPTPFQQAWHGSGAQKHGAWKHFHSTPRSICDLSIQKRGCQVWQGCRKDSAQLAQTGVWILVSLGVYLYDAHPCKRNAYPNKHHCRCRWKGIQFGPVTDIWFIVLQPQAAVLPGSYAGSEFCHSKPSDLAVPDVWVPLIGQI